MARADAALLPSRQLPITFLRAHADAGAGSAAAELGLTCDEDWVTFMRGVACPAAPPPPSRAPPAPPPPPPRGVTVVTQLTADRLWMLVELARRWAGPVVAALLQPVGAAAAAALPAELRARVQLLPFRQRAADDAYPINALRNRAVAAVRTSHYLVCDVDLWPSASLHAELAALDAAWYSSRRLALAVPAFQHEPGGGGGAALPETAAALRACVAARRCAAFKGIAGFVPGQHLSTDYARWWARAGAALPYRVPCVDKVSWEPYLVLPAGAAPAYDERFTGYGKNKVQHVQALRAAGFHFWVLPRGFLLHTPHALSASGRKWQSNAGEHRARMDALFDAQLAAQPARERAVVAVAPRDGCAAVTPSCEVPLLQQVDMLQPGVLGRRAPLPIDG